MMETELLVYISVILLLIMIISCLYLEVANKTFKRRDSASEKIISELKEVATTNSSLKTGVNQFVNKNYDNKLDELIKIYHEQALSQAKIQFWFSLIAAVVGFVVIICVFVFSKSAEWYEHIVKILPGGIIETVSLLFFTQSRETRERGSDFLNRLRIDRQYEKSISIVETITDEVLRDRLKGEIALHLCDIKNTDSDLSVFEKPIS